MNLDVRCENLRRETHVQLGYSVILDNGRFYHSGVGQFRRGSKAVHVTLRGLTCFNIHCSLNDCKLKLMVRFSGLEEKALFLFAVLSEELLLQHFLVRHQCVIFGACHFSNGKKNRVLAFATPIYKNELNNA